MKKEGEGCMLIKKYAKRERMLRRLAISLTVMVGWILIWALVLKMCDEEMLVRNYYNLRNMSLIDRIKWDLIPFNYRKDDPLVNQQIIVTILNCFVFVPFGVTLCYVFKKPNVLRDASLCLAFSLGIEALQLFTPFGNPATEDLITNVLGYFLGLAIYYVFLKRLSTKWSAVLFWLFNFIAAAVTVYTLVTAVASAPLIYRLVTKTY